MEGGVLSEKWRNTCVREKRMIEIEKGRYCVMKIKIIIEKKRKSNNNNA